MDYGQFYLVGSAEDGVDLPDVVDRAIDDGLYAITAGGNMVVLSPHQYNSAMLIDFELFDRAQHPDRDEWQVVIDATTTIDDQGELWISSATSSSHDPLLIAPGSYHIEISGRGLRFEGQLHSTNPGDTWRIRMWPSDANTALQYPLPKRWR
ncbi:hypothetical protein [Nocardia altamirensis]|uniref:hypothetical protein n=1 Tax=Nocardia altamirensis TaxID=472158 RepID=UPI00114CBF8B|nr:hypothetical protein [Nocardia altamirensis]